MKIYFATSRFPRQYLLRSYILMLNILQQHLYTCNYVWLLSLSALISTTMRRQFQAVPKDTTEFYLFIQLRKSIHVNFEFHICTLIRQNLKQITFALWFYPKNDLGLLVCLSMIFVKWFPIWQSLLFENILDKYFVSI